jgi:hypothetical protein
MIIFKKITSVYSEDFKKPVHTFCEKNELLLIVETGSTCSYYCCLKNNFTLLEIYLLLIEINKIYSSTLNIYSYSFLKISANI